CAALSTRESSRSVMIVSQAVASHLRSASCGTWPARSIHWNPARGGVDQRFRAEADQPRKKTEAVLRGQIIMAAPIYAPNRRRSSGTVSPKTKSRISAARTLFVAIDLLAFLVALLRFHRERRDGPGFEPF